MKKNKLINIINLICLFSEIYGVLMIICSILRGIFEIKLFTNIILIPHDVVLETYSSKMSFPLTILLGFFCFTETFLIIEKYKFSKYFFQKNSNKLQLLIGRFSIFAFIITILFSSMYCLIMIF